MLPVVRESSCIYEEIQRNLFFHFYWRIECAKTQHYMIVIFGRTATERNNDDDDYDDSRREDEEVEREKTLNDI